MTENQPMIKGDWRKATNEQIVSNLVEKIEELLDADIQYSSLLDSKGNLKRKISITYNE